jgi:hypothetical protein
MTKSLQHHTVVLKLPDPVPALLLRGRHVVMAITNSAWLSGLLAQLPPVTAALDDLDTLEVATRSRAAGSAAVRDDQKKTVVDALTGLAAGVQAIVNQQPNDAAAIIASAAMFEKGSSARAKPGLAASMGPVPGQVLVRAKAVKRAAYEWQMSTDDGVTWVAVALTTVANTSVTGLARGTTCLFRVRTTRGSVTTGWSQILGFFVH